MSSAARNPSRTTRPTPAGPSKAMPKKPWRREALLLVMLAIALFMAMSLLSFSPADPSWFNSGKGETVQNWGGEAGSYLAEFLVQFLGMSAWLLPLALLGWVAQLWNHWFRQRPGRRLAPVGGLAIFLGLMTFLAIVWPSAWWSVTGTLVGGIVGQEIAQLFQPLIGSGGSALLFFAILVFGLFLLTGLGPREMLAKSQQELNRLSGLNVFARVHLPRFSRRQPEPSQTRVAAPIPAAIPEKAKPAVEKTPGFFAAKKSRPMTASSAPKNIRQMPLPAPVGPPRADGLPDLALLDPADPMDPTGQLDPETLAQQSRMLEEKMADFGVQASVVAANPGPVITRFEIEPAPGVKVSQVAGLSKDLSRVLAARVRVVEAIPGKATMGIEVPNPKRRTVRLSEILSSSGFSHSKSFLTLALGQDIGGQPVSADLAKMPHLLVAGTTGAGKSVGVNAMILSILFKATAEEVRLIMVDPKMLELSIYEGIPHLLAPVVTDMKEAANALRWCVAEMERRYKLMAFVGVRNLAGYNQKVQEALSAGQPLPGPDKDLDGEPISLSKLPAIVVIIDEFADLMMVVGKQVETLITRLAQKARAAGLHLIMATQRPSVDVITGLIKANVPTRIAFQVSSRIDSRTILDQMGAETLLGQGDMLYLPPGSGYPQRVHGAFVSDDEVHRVVESLRQLGAPQYDERILQGGESIDGEDIDGGGGEDADPLYDQAVAIVTTSRKASISYVQRQLKVGYNRAARMIEEMERVGVVGPLQSNGSREIYAAAPPSRD
ncbi:DNA translocase FtsK [Acidithiobacillus concretivorus]|uniref:DNA translocase FtsK n=1 Tax=Acidithiobacillus concretivorus TaxID=3063952 RepID=A0ABS5ZS06_9PROT|nr:DNA translocase FtsK [Acidithiobacillus concretivorus]MBU2739463.1 DNA translocase FtsK [Acidithiobacillus concretivorus]